MNAAAFSFGSDRSDMSRIRGDMSGACFARSVRSRLSHERSESLSRPTQIASYFSFRPVCSPSVSTMAKGTSFLQSSSQSTPTV